MVSNKSLSSKLKVKKRKTMKKSNYSNSYLEFLKKKKAMSKVKNPIDNIVSQNVELMGNISPQNIPDIDKPSNQISVKSIENPKIDIKMPKSVESKSNKNIKKVYVEEGLKHPKFSFDRSSKKNTPKKKNKKKSEMKKSKKKKKTKRKSRKVSFTVKKPNKSECDRFKKVNDDIDKKDDVEVDSILKGKGIKTTGKNRKLKRDLLKCMDDKISVKKE